MKLSRRTRDWVEDSLEWLGELWGEFEAAGFTAPAFERLLKADGAEYLSAGCTIRHLKTQGEEVQKLLADSFQRLEAFITKNYPGNKESATGIVDGYRLADALSVLQVPTDRVLEIDAKLKQIRNVS